MSKIRKKVAIVSIYDENNYGNRLQNYAVQSTLENLGYKVETLVAQKQETQKKCIKAYILCVLAHISLKFVSRFKLQYSRNENFKRFTTKRIHTRYIYSNNGNYPDSLQKEYDYFVVGSDQVWNPCFKSFAGKYEDRFLLFVNREKRVCFSPSFGVSEIPSEWEQRFIDGLNGFNELSVRESSGADIIRKIVGKDSQVLIDPTMMLDAHEWLKIAKKVDFKNKPYVFEYFLGERNDVELNKIAKVNKLQRLTLMDTTKPDLYITNPGEFVYMISNADLVCTDSFHACVFSILFGKPFIVSKRKDDIRDMHSRIDTLLKLFNVEAGEMPIIVSQEVRDNVLKIERKKVIDFLKRNLNYEN